MISLPGWLTTPFDALRNAVGGTRWVEPWNDITVAVYASLASPTLDARQAVYEADTQAPGTAYAGSQSPTAPSAETLPVEAQAKGREAA